MQYKEEIWKDIKEYPGYQVSNWGRVRSLNYLHTGQMVVLKLSKNKYGYLEVGLCKNGKKKSRKVHRLVAVAFIPNPLNLPEVNHKDENKENNFVWVNEDGTIDLEKSNLEWVSHIQNCRAGTRNQRIAESLKEALINHPVLSKRVAQYTLDGELVAIYPSAREAARQTGFNYQNICSCCLGKYKQAYGYIWKYID